MIDSGPIDADAPVTRVGGVPLAPEGTAWPCCSSCDGPMQFLAQIVLADLDSDDGGSGSGPSAQRGVLALFACQNDPGACEDWDASSGGNRALVFPLDGLQPIPLPRPDGKDAEDADDAEEDGYGHGNAFDQDEYDHEDDDEDDDEGVLLLGATRAVGLDQEGDPDYGRARAAWAARTGNATSAVLGQLGGRPDWLQFDETPSCSSCARPMSFVAQLQEGPDPITAMNFGGGGRAYAFVCEPCAGAAFLWQC
ncbi:hypothetical protein GCM10010505_18270 [Kitasatospora aburaviensis]